MAKSSVGIRELKTNLSKYLRQVKTGQTVVITERGEPIGRIVPEGRSLEERLQILAATGLLQQVGGKLPVIQAVAVNRGSGQVSDLVVEGRDVDYLS